MSISTAINGKQVPGDQVLGLSPLRRWRYAQARAQSGRWAGKPKPIQALCDEFYQRFGIRVALSTWHDWETGHRVPSGSKLMHLSAFTDGAVTWASLQAWHEAVRIKGIVT